MNPGKHSGETIESLRYIIHQSYGYTGTLTRLPGENLNYLLNTDSGQKFIAKLADDDTAPDVVDMEFAALEHALCVQNELALPAIVKNNNRQIETRINIPNSRDKRLRLLHYVDGSDLAELTRNTDISGDFRYHLGTVLAQFDLQMADFDHPAAHREHRWDLANAAQHQAKTSLVSDLANRELLRWAFNQFTNNISSVLPSLPWQFIHGDANPENIRVSGNRVTGLVDFGDSCFNPTVCELAICLAYQMMDLPKPMLAAEQLLAGYESIRPLSGEEHAVLLPLACARLAVSIAVATERRTIDASNSNWFVSEAPAWRLLSWFRQNA